MKSKLCLLLLAISATLGCYMKARLYPVQGPLSAQTPVPVLMAKVTGKINPEAISVVLSDGEVCKGPWVFVNNVPSSKGSSITAPNAELAEIWDSIYGPNYYTSHIVGTKYYAQAVARGNRGTILRAEMNGFDKGVAKDDKGNIYKLVLQH
jgi:hypothetical protein